MSDARFPKVEPMGSVFLNASTPTIFATTRPAPIFYLFISVIVVIKIVIIIVVIMNIFDFPSLLLLLFHNCYHCFVADSFFHFLSLSFLYFLLRCFTLTPLLTAHLIRNYTEISPWSDKTKTNVYIT